MEPDVDDFAGKILFGDGFHLVPFGGRHVC